MALIFVSAIRIYETIWMVNGLLVMSLFRTREGGMSVMEANRYIGLQIMQSIGFLEYSNTEKKMTM